MRSDGLRFLRGWTHPVFISWRGIAIVSPNLGEAQAAAPRPLGVEIRPRQLAWETWSWSSSPDAGFASLLSVLLMLPQAVAVGGCSGRESITPKRAHPTITSGRELGTETILGSEALQPLLILCLGGMVKIDIWDALLLPEFY